MVAKIAKWKEEFLARIKLLPNIDLMNETSVSAGGDDYDGCFTARGQWEYDALNDELTARLVAIGFITQADAERST